MHGWVQSSSELLHELWWNCATSAECKTDRSAVLTVKSGLDPHMIIELKDGFNIAFRLFLWPCWVPTISVLILAYAVQRRTLEWSNSSTTRSSEDAINQSDACGRWRWSHVFIVIVVRVKTFESTLVSVIKVNKPFLYIFEHCFVILHSWIYHMCEIVILTHIWDAFGFLRKNRCDTVVGTPCHRCNRILSFQIDKGSMYTKITLYVLQSWVNQSGALIYTDLRAFMSSSVCIIRVFHFFTLILCHPATCVT
jgi:hypothetical protein